MGAVYNIRGTNGAGKSTLARAFLPPNLKGDAGGGPVDLNSYTSPTIKNPTRQLRVEGYGWSAPWGGVGVIGKYTTACGGLDTVPSFPVQQEAIRYMLEKLRVEHVIAEGVLASTVFGSWAVFDRDCEEAGHTFAWCYLDTPLDICFKHIRQRQLAASGLKPIKEDLVSNKHRAIQATRARAIGEGRLVYDLPWQTADVALRAIMEGSGGGYRAHS